MFCYKTHAQTRPITITGPCDRHCRRRRRRCARGGLRGMVAISRRLWDAALTRNIDLRSRSISQDACIITIRPKPSFVIFFFLF